MLNKRKVRIKLESCKEYLAIGEQLKNITFVKIAEKMEVHHNVVGMISKMTDEDVRLVKLLTNERHKLMSKRRELREVMGTESYEILLQRFKESSY